MELTSSLETERHMAKELASKLSNMGVELEESKQNVSNFNLDRSFLSVKSLKGFFGDQGTAYGNRIYLNDLVAKFMIRTQDFLWVLDFPALSPKASGFLFSDLQENSASIIDKLNKSFNIKRISFCQTLENKIQFL